LVVVEDHVATRDALAVSLRLAGFEVVGTFGSGEEVLEALPHSPADLLLLDLGLPGISGHDTIRRLRAIDSTLPILVLTVMESPDAVVGALEAGATGYLLKDTPLLELPAAIEQVRDGLSPLSPAIARHVISTLRARATEDVMDAGLAPRELAVLELLVEGCSYPAIAVELGIGLGTVQTYMKAIYRKLGVRSKAAAAALAVRSNILSRRKQP